MGSSRSSRSNARACPEDRASRSRSSFPPSTYTRAEGSLGAQFHWNPDTYLEQIRAEVPRYDELQKAAVEAVPFAPDRVLELGMGTGETTRVLLESHPD